MRIPQSAIGQRCISPGHTYILIRSGSTRSTPRAARAQPSSSDIRFGHAVGDDDDFIPPYVAEWLLAMTTSLPYEPDEPEPVDDLDLVQSALLQDFTHECRRETQKFLKQYDGSEEEDMCSVGERYAKARAEIESILRKFRSDLRAPRLDDARRNVIEEKLSAIEALYEKLPYAHLGEERRIMAAGEAVERAVLESLSRQPICEVRHIVRWRTVD